MLYLNLSKSVPGFTFFFKYFIKCKNLDLDEGKVFLHLPRVSGHFMHQLKFEFSFAPYAKIISHALP